MEVGSKNGDIKELKRILNSVMAQTLDTNNLETNVECVSMKQERSQKIRSKTAKIVN